MARLNIEELTDAYETQVVESVGAEPSEWERAHHTSSPASRAFMGISELIVDSSGVVARIEAAIEQERRSNAGRESHIPVRAVLILLIAHTLAGMATPKSIAATMMYVLTDGERRRLGITAPKRNSLTAWAEAFWRAEQRLIHAMDPYRNEFDRRRILLVEEADQVRLGYSTQRHDFMDELMNSLIAATVKRLPDSVMSGYVGNVALDATRVKVQGRWNPSEIEKKRRNRDPIITAYTRAKLVENAYELETAVMAPNQPDKIGKPVPTLITGVSFHRAGKLRHAAWVALEAHLKLTNVAKDLLVDMAYPNLKAYRFMSRAMCAGLRPVFDYKEITIVQPPVSWSAEHLLMVDGNWYVDVMPIELVQASTEYVKKSITEVEYLERLDQRRKYRLTPKGKVDPDGFQRFLRPDPSAIVVFDKITHKPLKLRWKKTVTVPPFPEAQRLQQYYQYGTPEWQKRYSLRNVVEASNSGLKSLRTDLANPVKRAGNGFAYHYLKSVIACVAENLHRIVAFLRDQYKSANRKLNGPSIRERRRKDQMTGLPLERSGYANEAESPPGRADDPGLNS